MSPKPAAAAATNTLDSLAGTWYDLDSFATIGQCIGSPSDSSFYLCSPAHLSRVQKPRFEGGGMLSATDSVLSVADTLRKNEVSYNDVNNLFKDYNYSDLIVNTELNYVGKGILIGIRPIRYEGQFQVHNPNLPLASLAFRKDMDVHAGVGFGFDSKDWKAGAGVIGAVLSRKESLVEANLIDLASTPSGELVDSQSLTGYFFDVGGGVEYKGFVSVAASARDLGGWFGGKQDHTSRYLFISPDKVPRVLTTVSFLPSFFGGKAQIGASLLRFLNRRNGFDQQWFGTLSYYVGPLRVLSGFRPDFFRTGLGIRFFRFDVTVAQEWVNKLETGRNAQPRFTLGVSSSL